MTLILIIFGAGLVAQTILLSLIWMTLRYGFRMLLLQGSQRRQWVKEEHRKAIDVRERLAEYSHDSAWGGWMRYQFGKGTLNEDGTWTMPAWAVERWTRQMQTAYADLPEAEKMSDRAEAGKMLAIMQAAQE